VTRDHGAGEEALARALREDVPAVLRAIEGSSVEELRLERGGRAIFVRRDWREAPPPEGGAAPAAAVAPPLSRLPGPVRAEVHAQVVGVFHRSRTADGPALASVGDAVKSGTAIGVVETLGIANDVAAPIAGVLVELAVEDGQPVGYGQLLAVIEGEE
jgi:acetyl-CoA carboxylase biotin carboxyl carrier protein